MNNHRLERLIRRIASSLEGEPGFWRIDFQGRPMLVITDEGHNRMRAMTRVADEADLNDRDRQIVLAANFDRALDARYAVSNGQLWSVFVHPLAELTDAQFFDALEQVKALAENYGTSYSSSDLVFGGGS